MIKGGYMDGSMLDAAGASALAELESREVMLSKIAGLLKGEMSRAAAAFIAAQSQFLSLLEAYKEKLPAGDEPAAEAEPAAEVAEEEAPAAEEAPATEASAEEAPVEEAAATSTEEEADGESED